MGLAARSLLTGEYAVGVPALMLRLIRARRREKSCFRAEKVPIAQAGGADREVADRPQRQCWVREGQVVLIAETSNSRVILSLTRTPPVSSAAFQVMP